MALAQMVLERPREDTGGTVQHLEGNTQVLAAEAYNLRNTRDQQRLSGILTMSRATNRNAWKWFDRIGEVHFALTRAARIAGYAKLHAVKYGPDGKTVDTTIDTGLPAEIVSGIYSRIGGTRGLLERYFLHMKVPAESHLVRIKVGSDYDGYQFVSSKELNDGKESSLGVTIEGDAKLGKLKIRTMPIIAGVTDSAFEIPLAQKDYLGRIWQPSPEWLDIPESPLEALDVQCDVLDSMTRAMSANLKSRFAVAGILYFSSKVREAFGGNEHKAKAGETVLNVLYNIMKSNLESLVDSNDVRAIIPILMQGDADPKQVAEHITIDRQIFETDLKLRSELIERILFGLDINAASTKGNEDTSHWGAWQNSADELRLAVIPDLQAATWAFTRLVLRQQLVDAKVDDPHLYGVGYTLDEASVRANRASDAREMRDKGAINIASMLQANGFTPEDALAGDEYARWLGITLRIPRLAVYGTPEFDGLTGADGVVVPWDDPTLTPTKTGRIADGTGGDPKSEPGQGDPGSPDDTEDDTPKSDKPT